MKVYQDKVIAITGAGGGIGRALAENLAKRGARLALSDIDPKALAATKGLLGEADVMLQTVDVAKASDLHAFADAAAKTYGGVDGIINNAGVTLLANTAKTSMKDFEWVMQINFWGVVHGTQAFLPLVRDAKEGLIANMSSIFGIVAYPDQGAYNASKFAVRGYTEALRLDLAGEAPNVHVACIHPGGVDTGIIHGARMGESTNEVPKAKIEHVFKKLAPTSADLAARTILGGVQDGSSRILIGPDAKRMDLFQRAMPQGYQRFLPKAYS